MRATSLTDGVILFARNLMCKVLTHLALPSLKKVLITIVIRARFATPISETLNSIQDSFHLIVRRGRHLLSI